MIDPRLIEADARLEDELDRLERIADVQLSEILYERQLSRYTLPERDAYGRLADLDGWLGGER